MGSLVLPESGLSFSAWCQLDPKTGRAGAASSFLRLSWEVVWNHVCCLLLVKTSTEPPQVQETLPPGGRGCGYMEAGRRLTAIFAGNLRPSPASFRLAQRSPRGCGAQHVPPVRRQPARCMGSEESCFIKRSREGLCYPHREQSQSHLALRSGRLSTRIRRL